MPDILSVCALIAQIGGKPGRRFGHVFEETGREFQRDDSRSRCPLEESAFLSNAAMGKDPSPIAELLDREGGCSVGAYSSRREGCGKVS